MHGTPALVVMGEAVDAGRQGREESAFADGVGRAVNNEDIDIQLDEEVNGSNNRGECDNSRTQLQPAGSVENPDVQLDRDRDADNYL